MDGNGDLKNFQVTVFTQFNSLDKIELTGKGNVAGQPSFLAVVDSEQEMWNPAWLGQSLLGGLPTKDSFSFQVLILVDLVD